MGIKELNKWRFALGFISVFAVTEHNTPSRLLLMHALTSGQGRFIMDKGYEGLDAELA